MEASVVVVDEDAQAGVVEVEVFADRKDLAQQVRTALLQGMVFWFLS